MNTFVSLKTFHLVGFFFVCSLIYSCAEDLNDVGLEISPINRVLVYHDSATMMNSYTQKLEDIILINKPNLFLGYMVDSGMWVFQNNFMAEVATEATAVDFGENPVADSVVLFLSYVSAYGDTITPQTIALYELNKDMELENIDSLPNTDATIDQFYDDDKFLGSYTFIPKSQKTVLRFKLPESLAQRLMDTSNFKYYDTVPNFNKYVFRGLYIMSKPLTQGGSTCNFSYSDSSFIQLFYQNDYTDTIKKEYYDKTNRDTTVYLTYPYVINSSTNKCNVFKRAFNENINIVPYQTDPVPSTEQELCYIKGHFGCETRIDIIDLNRWLDSGYVAFNKAFLTVYTDYTDTIEEKAYPPIGLGIYRLGDTYNYYNTSLDQDITVLYDTTLNAYYYYVKLTDLLFSTVQEGKDTLSIIFTSPNNLAAPNRMILKGAKNLEKPMRLDITYTKIN